MWGIIAFAAAATGWHAVTEHHVHLRVLRIVRPGTRVPSTTHDAWWHSLPRSHRIAVQATLTAAGLVAGFAYQAAPAVAMAVLGVIVAAAAGLLVIRAVGGRSGGTS